ncbi:N-acetylmuramoyl-L-alanine amidase CwlD [Clostridium peptidivorans]|uniref:N-acetylmuramoyl-L-alanine amidase CwlD n=1 Tax=Clostridium peptidivorans TaxID=100174 RepID=UPI003BFA741A
MLRQYKKICFFSVILLTITIWKFIPNVLARKEIANEKPSKIILLDPGHGGMDGGAVSPTGTIEKHINLNIGIKLKNELEKQGFKVIMTREEDKGLYSEGGTVREKKREDLSNRSKMIVESNCDIFVSIHLNMFPQRKYYGAQVWYASNESSSKLANIIQGNFKAYLDNTNNRIEKPAKDEYRVLRGVGEIPAVLIECGFLSNEVEESKLKTDIYQEKIAKIIASSIQSYFEK